jgi:hypothetical protein
MASKHDEQRWFYSTEEVLAYFCTHSISDVTASEGSEDDWLSDDSYSDESAVVKPAKFGVSTAAIDVQPSKQTISNCAVCTKQGDFDDVEYVVDGKSEWNEESCEITSEEITNEINRENVYEEDGDGECEDLAELGDNNVMQSGDGEDRLVHGDGRM